jgi:hypothetical protein
MFIFSPSYEYGLKKAKEIIKSDIVLDFLKSLYPVDSFTGSLASGIFLITWWLQGQGF